MSKLLAGAAAIGAVALFALTAPAGANEQRAQGLHNADQSLEVSSARRHYRRYYTRRYYAPRYSYGYYDRPAYGAYAYSPYYRPYYRPGPYLGVGPGGVGFGFGF